MVRPRLKSTSLRKVFVRAPSGVRVHYRRGRQQKPKCRLCNDFLKGVPHGTNAQIRKHSKTEKRPSRMFGGNLCSKCMRKTLVERARTMING